jgi:hypothetical protein
MCWLEKSTSIPKITIRKKDRALFILTDPNPFGLTESVSFEIISSLSLLQVQAPKKFSHKFERNRQSTLLQTSSKRTIQEIKRKSKRRDLQQSKRNGTGNLTCFH